MEPVGRNFILLWVTVFGACVLALQRPPPRYSQQYMPETSFTCRNKIVGSYYADPETDCQVFHVCVSVSGSVQDYKFLCPNDTAFDQESQTCADWYDVDCEAATLYYASDNFDLYRIGSGLESLHYDSIRSDAEPQDHLQRSETSDPVRSSANSLNRVASSSNSNSNGNRDLRGSSSGNFYNNRNGKEDDYESEKTYNEEVAQDAKKKAGVRKVSRKQQYNDNGNSNYAPSSTPVPSSAGNQNTYTGFYSGSNYNQRSNSFVSSSSARPQENFNRNQNTQRYNTPSSTYRPSTNYQNNNNYNNFQSPSTTTRTTIYNAYNTNSNYNQQNAGDFSQSTTAKSTSYNKNYNQNYNNGGQFVQSTTLQPSTNYQGNDYTNYQRNYNNIQRGNGNVPHQSTTAAPTIYDNNYNSNNNNNNNNNHGQYRTGTTRQDNAQSTTKYVSSFASSSYAPTTYSPATKKFIPNDNNQAQTSVRANESGQYYEKSSQPVKSSSQYYESTKAPKKATQYNNYDGSNGKYYAETSTANYDIARSSIGIGFSPASINHLAETPRSTTPVPRRISTVTTYNPNHFNSNTQKPPQSPTTPRGSTYVSGSARPFSSTTRLPNTTTPRTKTGKKSDYDYAYYDNTAGLEYDSLDLEHVTGNKESAKIARN